MAKCKLAFVAFDSAKEKHAVAIAEDGVDPDLQSDALQHALGNAVVGVELRRRDDSQPLELFGIGDDVQVLETPK
jgi:hypothetical protein